MSANVVTEGPSLKYIESPVAKCVDMESKGGAQNRLRVGGRCHSLKVQGNM